MTPNINLADSNASMEQHIVNACRFSWAHSLLQTKSVCEDMFMLFKDAERQNKNRKLGLHRAHFIASSARHLANPHAEAMENPAYGPRTQAGFKHATLPYAATLKSKRDADTRFKETASFVRECNVVRAPVPDVIPLKESCLSACIVAIRLSEWPTTFTCRQVMRNTNTYENSVPLKKGAQTNRTPPTKQLIYTRPRTQVAI
jgi:hypothetical protein